MTWQNKLDKTLAAQGCTSGLSAEGNVQERGGRMVKTDEKDERRIIWIFSPNFLSRGIILKQFLKLISEVLLLQISGTK